MLYLWKREQGELTAKSPSDLGLEMHLVVGLLDVVPLKCFSSFGFIKNITPEIRYLLFWLQRVFVFQLQQDWFERKLFCYWRLWESRCSTVDNTECVCSTAKCKVKHFLYPFVSHAVVPLPLQRGHMIYNYKRFDPFPSPGRVWRGSPTAVFMVKLSLLGLYSNHWITYIGEKKKDVQ